MINEHALLTIENLHIRQIAAQVQTARFLFKNMKILCNQAEQFPNTAEYKQYPLFKEYRPKEIISNEMELLVGAGHNSVQKDMTHFLASIAGI
jgi:hypothetical protein